MRSTTVIATLALTATAVSAFSSSVLEAREDGLHELFAREDLEELYARDDAMEDIFARDDSFDDLVARDDYLEDMVARDVPNMQNVLDDLIKSHVQHSKRDLGGDFFNMAFGALRTPSPPPPAPAANKKHTHPAAPPTAPPAPPAAPLSAPAAPLDAPTAPPAPVEPVVAPAQDPPTHLGVAPEDPPTAREYLDMLEARAWNEDLEARDFIDDLQYKRDVTYELLRRAKGAKKTTASKPKASRPKPAASKTASKPKSGTSIFKVLGKAGHVASKAADTAEKVAGLGNGIASVAGAVHNIKEAFKGGSAPPQDPEQQMQRRDLVRMIARQMVEELSERSYYNDLD